MAETGISKNRILSELTKSPHGKLEEYLPIGQVAAVQEAEFFSHLISYNQVKGQIRDSKVALPVIALTAPVHEDFIENALAHIAILDPRNLVRAVRFAKTLKVGGRLRKLVSRYLAVKESNWAKWEKLAVQHHNSLKELYALLHIKPGTMADAILFKGEKPKGSVFEAIANLKNMSVSEAAGTIMERRIPFLIAAGALGSKMKEPDLVLALINNMSPTELVTNSKRLEKLGVKTVPALRAAYEQALGRAATSKKATLKTTRAAEAIDDEGISNKLRDLQEKQIKALGGVDGNWGVLADKSGSMNEAIEVSRQVAATLAKMVTGQVHLVFFDTSPRLLDVTGKTYEEILASTKHITANGGTSIGCALLALGDKGIEVDGIAVVSDGGENSPPSFATVYKAYSEALGKQVPVYLYKTKGEPDVFSLNLKRNDIDVNVFDLTHGTTDMYALPDTVKLMSVNRYSILDAVMACPLIRLEDVLGPETTKEKIVYA